MSDIRKKLEKISGRAKQSLQEVHEDRSTEERLLIVEYLEEWSQAIIESHCDIIERIERLEGHMKKIDTDIDPREFRRAIKSLLVDAAKTDNERSAPLTEADKKRQEHADKLNAANTVNAGPAPPQVTSIECSPAPRELSETELCDLAPKLQEFRRIYTNDEQLVAALRRLLRNQEEGAVSYTLEAEDAITAEIDRLTGNYTAQQS